MKPSTLPTPSIQPQEVEDDAAQDISDDGELPTYTPGADDEDMSESEDESASDPDASAMDEDENGEAKPKFHQPNTSAWKAPTTEEVANIKAASQLFKSNAFKLKVSLHTRFTSCLSLSVCTSAC